MKVTGIFTFQSFVSLLASQLLQSGQASSATPTMLSEAWSTEPCDHRLNPPTNINLFHCLEDLLTPVFCYSTKSWLIQSDPG